VKRKNSNDNVCCFEIFIDILLSKMLAALQDRGEVSTTKTVPNCRLESHNIPHTSLHQIRTRQCS
jgi:hypothetical protein